MKSFAHRKEDGKGKCKAEGLSDNILIPYTQPSKKKKTEGMLYQIPMCFLLYFFNLYLYIDLFKAALH